ncbi:MAG: hypothetical protein B7Y47_15595 [Sphingomonas sp. 28-63-12]|nr:MAG: hypothetical protein B7Y47_15595 [Sphingomonas sp. 28-63-12]
MSIAVAQSSFWTSLSRYGRSKGLWLLLLVAPIGARFMIAPDDGSGIQIAVGRHLPVMTSAMLGISLGIVVSTLLLPIGFVYLRSNVTRRQPWQIDEVSAASRIAMTLGRFGADVAILFGVLAALTAAGWFLGAFIVTGPLNIGDIVVTLWLVAAPAVMGLVAIHLMFDALPVTRRATGELLYFILWMVSLVMPLAAGGSASSFSSNMLDFPGFVRPLIGAAPLQGQDIVIGGSDGLLPGRKPLDVMAGINAPGYLASRAAWAMVAILVAALAGLVYRPHRPPRRSARKGIVARWLAPGPPAPADHTAPPALPNRLAFAGLVLAEFRAIGVGRPFLLMAFIAALVGIIGDFRHIGSPTAMLLLIFAAVAHAGRSEARGLLALTQVTVQSPNARRIAFILATIGWSLLLAVPGAIVRISSEPLLLALITGGVMAIVAIGLAMFSRSAFAPRLVLLVLWYGYLSS